MLSINAIVKIGAKVRMHIGEPRHEVLALPGDPYGAGRCPYLICGTDRQNSAVLDEHGLLQKHAVSIHWDDRDAHKRRHALSYVEHR